MGIRALLLAASMSLSAGCASTLKDFTPPKKDSENTVVGRVSIFVNGNDETEHCMIWFNESPRRWYKLGPQGLVAYKIRRGPARLSSIFCPGSGSYDLQGNEFTVSADSRTTYFGDVTLRWTIGPPSAGRIALGVLFMLALRPGPSRQNDGAVTVTAEDRLEQIRTDLSASIPFDDSAGYSKSLITVLGNQGNSGKTSNQGS